MRGEGEPRRWDLEERAKVGGGKVVSEEEEEEEVSRMAAGGVLSELLGR